MKQSQTLKLDPKILRELKQEAKRKKIPFNRHAEDIFRAHVIAAKFNN